MKSNLDFLLRKNKGKHELPNYKRVFVNSGFNESNLVHVELKESDNILISAREIFVSVNDENEMLSDKEIFIKSKLLSSIFRNAGYSLESYIFSDEVNECGMFKVETEDAIKNCLNLAKCSTQNTCFLIGLNFDFFFTINYYDSMHIDQRNSFDIQVKIIGV